MSRDYSNIPQRARCGIKIAPKETGESYLCWVIGVSQEKRCLVMTAPVRADRSLAAITKGQVWFTCRMFSSTSVFRFRGAIVKVAFEPYPYLHVVVPEVIEKRLVRQLPRALVSLAGTLAIPAIHAVTIVDLSVGGARIAVDGKLALEMGATVKLVMSLEVIGKSRDVCIDAKVVAQYGVADIEASRVSRSMDWRSKAWTSAWCCMLHGYVQQQLASEYDGLEPGAARWEARAQNKVVGPHCAHGSKRSRSNTMATPPPDSRKLYRQVADAIMASIKSGDFKPGTRLPSERDLAASFKVSRPTIREAMIALEIRGMVESRHGSGIYVTEHPPTQMGADDLDIGAFELTEARRRLFEGEAAALAATTITDEQLEELEAIVADMVKENTRKQAGEMADRRFHVVIAQATRNTAIATVIENLWDIRYKSPLCRHMLERARSVGDAAADRGAPADSGGPA